MGQEQAETVLRWPAGPGYVGRLIHAMADDDTIWRRWNWTLTERPLRMWFDVGVGSWPSPPPGGGPEMNLGWRYINQRRIDLVMEWPEEVWLVEIHRAPSAASVGRLLHYKRLWALDDPIGKPVRLVLVANWWEPEILGVCNEVGIEYIIV